MTRVETLALLLVILCVASAIYFLGWQAREYRVLKEAELHFQWGRQRVEAEVDYVKGIQPEPQVIILPPK